MVILTQKCARRSTWCYWRHSAARETINVLWHCNQCLWICYLLRPYHRRSIDGSCKLALVFLDVRLLLAAWYRSLTERMPRNLPIGGVACFLVLAFLHLPHVDSPSKRLPLKTKLRRMDVGGSLILIGAVCCLLLALQWGGTASPWRSSRIIGLFVGFGLLSAAFGILQWRLGDDATTPLRILRQRSIYMGSAYVAFTNMAIFTVLIRGLFNAVPLLIVSLACILSAFLLPSRARCE